MRRLCMPGRGLHNSPAAAAAGRAQVLRPDTGMRLAGLRCVSGAEPGSTQPSCLSRQRTPWRTRHGLTRGCLAGRAGAGGGADERPDFLPMFPWYSGTSADMYRTIFDLAVSLKLFLGRFDMRTMQARALARRGLPGSSVMIWACSATWLRSPRTLAGDLRKRGLCKVYSGVNTLGQAVSLALADAHGLVCQRPPSPRRGSTKGAC